MVNFIQNKKGLQIIWPFEDYPVDIIPVNSFDKECSKLKSQHDMRYTQDDNEVVKANYYKTVRGRIAIFTFSEDLNDAEDVDAGTLIIVFEDKTRKKVEDVFFIDDEGPTFPSKYKLVL